MLLVISVSMLMWRHSVQDPLLLHLYYIPVLLTGFYLGGYRARVAALLCVVTAFSLFAPNIVDGNATAIPLATLLAYLLWSGTLLMVAVLTGTLSDGLRKAMKETESSLKKDALTDGLTGIANRRAFDLEIAGRLAEQPDKDKQLALILVDIDFFKGFNDRYGHQTGDAVLKQVAHVFQKVVRSSDLLARYGGEEFAVVLPDVTLEDALQIAERSRNLIESHRFDYQGLVHRLTVSVGVSFATPVDDAETFCERADAALYTSKAAGRNCVHHHDGDTCHAYGNGFKTSPVSSKADESPSPDGNVFSDAATGLPTQLVFVEELRRRVLEKQRYGVPVTIVLIEFDDFPTSLDADANMRKSVSATAARMISSSVRDSDFVANWSAGTFSVLLPSTSVMQALVPIGRLHESARSYCDPQYPSLSYSISVGVVEVGFSDQYGDTVQRVKATLAEAKASAPHTLKFHDGMSIQCFEAVKESLATEEPTTVA